MILADIIAKAQQVARSSPDEDVKDLAILVAALAEGLRRGGGASEESGWKEDK